MKPAEEFIEAEEVTEDADAPAAGPGPDAPPKPEEQEPPEEPTEADLEAGTQAAKPPPPGLSATSMTVVFDLANTWQRGDVENKLLHTFRWGYAITG